VVLTTLAIPGRSYGSLEAFEKASIFGAIGEANHLYLIPNGIYFHPQYNDVTGDTDKLLTSSIKLGVLDGLSDGWSYESCYYWRFLTPAFSSSTKRGYLEKPIGLYADWMELKTAVAKSIYAGSWLFRPQLSFGANHIGNKGAKKVHRWVHEVTKNSVEGLEYTNQPRGYFPSIGANVSLAHEIAKQGEQSASAAILVGVETSKMIKELFVEGTTIWAVRKGWWELAFDVRVIRQVDTDVYTDLKDYRYEGAASTALYGVYTPMIKYVSSYLKGDNVGQTYFDFLHFNYAF
jgi:hypothetical protein